MIDGALVLPDVSVAVIERDTAGVRSPWDRGSQSLSSSEGSDKM
jgi:hypothetical protein